MKRGTPGFVGARLKEGREARGLTATALSEILGVTKQSVSQYENEQQTPRPEVMQKIEQVLNLPPAFFSRPVEDEPGNRKIFYRDTAGVSKLVHVRMDRRYRWLNKIADYLEQFVSFPPVNFPRFEMPRDPAEISFDTIEALASTVREYWGLGEGPLSNLVSLLENNGAVVARGMMEADEADAFSEWREWHVHHERPYVFLGDDKHNAFRSRYDAAHELGHLVLHRNIDKKHLDNSRTHKLIERQAFRFAGAFLLPASSFANDFYAPSLDAFRALKPKWKVSVAMMVYRSADLGFVGKEQTRRLWINRTRRGWKFREPLDDDLPVEEPRLLRRAFELLVNEGVVSRDEIRFALPYALSDIEELAGLPPGFLEDKPAPISLKEYSKKRQGGDASRQPQGPGEVVNFRTTGDT